jgi:AraC-like DNA-binding protein
MVLLLRSAALTGYVEVARAVGLDPFPLLAGAGFSQACLIDPDLKISAVSFARLLEASAAASGRDDFGLRQAQSRDLANLGPLGLLLRDQPTFGAVLSATSRYLSLQTEGLTLNLDSVNDLAIVRMEILGTGAGPVRQAVELTVGTAFRTFRALLGDWWNPVAVCFRHAAPHDLALHLRFFGTAVDFRQDFDGMVFRGDDLAAPVPRADPVMARQAQKYLDILLAGPHATAADQVRQLAAVLLPSGSCTQQRIAAYLGIDERTLQRRLAREGHGFSGLIDDLRDEIALRYVTAGDRPLSEVSDLLGFSALSAFSRWFRRRHGCSVRDWRALQR